MEKFRFTAPLAALVGSVALGVCIIAAVGKYRSFERTVEVKGLCETEVQADRAIWSITYKVVADEVEHLYGQIDRQNGIITDLLKNGGLDEDDYTVGVPKVSDKLAEEYGNNTRAYRFIATSVVTVCTGKVDNVLELMSRQSELLKSGVLIVENSWENQTKFTYERLNDLKPIMIEEATRNAREAANKFAADSGSELGKIKRANQGVFSIESRDGNTPHIKRVRVVTTVTYYLMD